MVSGKIWHWKKGLEPVSVKFGIVKKSRNRYQKNRKKYRHRYRKYWVPEKNIFVLVSFSILGTITHWSSWYFCRWMGFNRLYNWLLLEYSHSRQTSNVVLGCVQEKSSLTRFHLQIPARPLHGSLTDHNNHLHLRLSTLPWPRSINFGPNLQANFFGHRLKANLLSQSKGQFFGHNLQANFFDHNLQANFGSRF